MFVEPVPSPTDIATDATTTPDSRGSEPTELVAETVAGGANRTSPDGRGNPPYQPDRPVRYNGSVSDIAWTTTDRQRDRTEYLLSLTVYGTDTDREPEIAFDELPAVDRERLQFLPQLIGHLTSSRA